MTTDNDKLNKREMFFLFISIIPPLKLIFIPEYAAILSGRDSWLIFVIIGIVEILFSLIFITAVEKSNIDIRKIRSKDGGIFLKLLTLLLFCISAFKAFMYFRQSLEFVYTSTYTFEPLWYFAVPMIIMEAAVQFTDVKNIVRLSCFTFGLLIVTYTVLIISGIKNFNIIKVKPVLDNGIKNILEKTTHFLTWSGDSILLLLLLPYYDRESKAQRGGLFGIASGNILTALIVFLFIGVFGDIAGLVTLSVTELPAYTGKSVIFADFEPMIRIIWTFSLFIRDVLYMSLAVKLFIALFGVKKTTTVKVILPVMLTVLSLVSFENEEYYFVFGTGTASTIAGAAGYFAVLYGSIVLFLSGRRKKNEVKA